jgi:D-serine deaminase-like pyridoxal phosphate-dependent protein
MKTTELDTPSLVVDLDQLEQNIARMARQVKASGAKLRPHTKTHKSAEIARMQLAHGASGITVAKLGEAEAMAAAGFDDIFIANELIGEEKLRRLAGLAGRIHVGCVTDSYEGAAQLDEAARSYGVNIRVLLDVNTGLDRAGVAPEAAVTLGKRIAADFGGIRLAGVFSFAGNAKEADAKARRRWAEREANLAVGIARELQAAGIDAREVSVAGSGSAVFAAAVPGVTEVRPGTYVFGDAGYASQGIGSLAECALRIRARVVSRPATDRAVIDAGSKVLTTEKRVVDGHDPGHGTIVGLPGTKIAKLWEEHGVLALDEEGKRLAIGDVIEIIPNHVCPTINLCNQYYGVRGGVVEQEFAVISRGLVQ